MVVDACSGVVAVVVAAADETSHAEARLAKPSQASQPREGLTTGFGYPSQGRRSTGQFVCVFFVFVFAGKNVFLRKR